MRKRIVAGAVGAMMALALSVTVLAGALLFFGTNAGLMQRQMERFAPAGATGLPAEEYAGMARMITDYLDGKSDEFQYVFQVGDGVRCAAFHSREQQHMADCQALFLLDKRVLIISGAAAAMLFALALLLRRGRSTARGAAIGAGSVLAAACAVGIWGAVDFDGLFILFHRLSFDNGLWLLDPATDLLIRLMPTQFFVDYAVKAAAIWMGGELLALLLALAAARKHKR